MSTTALVKWKEVEPGRIIPIALDKGQELDCAFSPLPGSQTAFLNCPIFETLYSGTRGNGKTDALLADFAQDVGKGYGRHWRGVLFRRTYKELEDVISKSIALYKRVFGGRAKYNASNHTWTWDTGEQLMLRYFRVPDDYWSYHGHAYPWIGWEELTTWPDDVGYKSMFSCARSTEPGLPIRIRANTNPYGIGHNWVKLRFRLPMRPFPNFIGKHITDDTDDEGRPLPPRFSIQGHISENFVLTQADPDYIQRIGAAARNEAMAKAWIDGSWDIVAGGMFDGEWDPKIHTLPRFEIPHRWKIDRSYDYGSAAPFAIIWTAEANGEDYRDHEGKWRSSVKGDLFIINEWYGWKKNHPNVGIGLTMAKTAMGIIERELSWDMYGKVKVGPADTNIFNEEDGTSLALSMLKPVRIKGKQYKGIGWVKADKGPGSRKMGWKVISERLENASAEPGTIREKPGLFIFDHCEQWIRTVPTLPRDEADMDDVDSESEDHMGDVTRYRCVKSGAVISGGRTTGQF